MLVFLPATTIGLQDPASAMRQSLDTARARQHFIASPFGTIHAATYTLQRPIGSGIPIAGYTLAGLDPRDIDITGAVDRSLYYGAINPDPPRVYPAVNREGKGDRLVPAPAPLPAAAPADEPEARPVAPDGAMLPASPDDESMPLAARPRMPLTDEEAAELDRKPQPEAAVVSGAPEEAGNAPSADSIGIPPPVDAAPPLTSDLLLANVGGEGTPAFGFDDPATRIYFGAAPLAGGAERVEPWAAGAAPILESPEANDPDLKKPESASAPAARVEGETVAGKGQVTGPGKRPKSPAERLALNAAQRAKAEKCLSEAIYFEARGESVDGQVAVAQVVMNRVFSGFYPPTVCGVVYQNARRHLACQFTFACDGIPDRVTEPDAWALAKKIAKDTLDGLLWLKKVGKATHYHAYWVRPNWIREMAKLQRLGVHTFYRPRAWGDGSDEPRWGDPAVTQAVVKKLEAEAKL